MEKTLTISIAAYNAAWCLSKCLDSFVASSALDDIEVLIINDGSTDDTQSIAERYQQTYPETFVAVQKANGGHGSTINTSIGLARGRYFKAVDADDEVIPEGLAALVSALKRTNSDMVLSPYYQSNVATNEVKLQDYTDEVDLTVDHDMPLENAPFPLRLTMPAITYRTTLLKSSAYRLEEHCFYVDMEFVLFPFIDVASVRLLREPVYQYYVGFKTQSVDRQNMIARRGQLKSVCMQLARCYQKECERMSAPVRKRYLWNLENMVLINLYKLLIAVEDDGESKKELMELEQSLRTISNEIYQDILVAGREQSSRALKLVSLMRKTRYMGYTWIHPFIKDKIK